MPLSIKLKEKEVMKELKSTRISILTSLILGVFVSVSSVMAQEYDDMYFNKSDRKKVKVEKKNAVSENAAIANVPSYNQVAKTTEVYSAKNVNPEYIARYKATESNEVQENAAANRGYTSDDYFIENYNDTDSNTELGISQNQIDYAALNKREQMSYRSNNNNFNNPYWRGYPYAGMGWGAPMWGSPWGYDPFMMGYDPFMMGYGSGLSMGFGYGFGTGFYPSMSYSLAMSWGTGYNPWGGWGAYPYMGMGGFYNPWAWGHSYGFGFNRFYGGFARPIYVVNMPGYENSGRNISYQPRSVRSNTPINTERGTVNDARLSNAESKIRVPQTRTVTSESTANGRISTRDYNRSQNEYYNNARRTSSSTERISTSSTSRSSFSRTSNSATNNTSTITNNRPSRVNTGSSSMSSGSGSSYSNYNSGRTSGNSSYSTPSRSTGDFNRSSYSSGSSSGSRSSFGGSSSGARMSSGGSSSGRSSSGGRQ